jgi:acyl carrier protein
MNEDKLYKTICEVFGVGVNLLSEDSSPDTLPNWDSLNHLNLVMALESEFQITLTPEDAINMRSVAQIRSTLREHGVEI